MIGNENMTVPRIAVVGVGGAGCNVVSSFYDDCLPVDTIAINTDKASLHERTHADTKLYICKEVLHGEGAHGNAELGRKCADIHMEEIRQTLSGHDAVFVIAGLGGGTGTGAASVVLDIAQSLGILTFAITISPFLLEGKRKLVAKEGLERVRAICTNCINVENDKVLERMPHLTMSQAFGEVNLSIKAHIKNNIKCLEDIFRTNGSLLPGMKVEPKDETPVSYPVKTLMSA